MSIRPIQIEVVNLGKVNDTGSRFYLNWGFATR